MLKAKTDKIVAGILVIFVILFLFSFYDGRVIVVKTSVELLLKPDWNNGDNITVALLKSGDKGTIWYTKYSKDSMFYKVRLEDGRTGFVEHDGEGARFEILTR